ncbi:MAG: phenylalanine--tRNA ligase subunit beta [Candidatus Parcubacteria bacterium]|nr:phenylalanine--tRNA ligase subunit beta [Candidatus Parcubacteria bacterium]
MLFSYNWLQSFFKGKLPEPKKLAELLTLHSFEVEEVKKQDKDWVFDINVTPNRGTDCFSHFGIAREISAFTKLKIKNEKLKIKEDGKTRINDFIDVKVDKGADCPRYTGRVLIRIKVGSSPKYIQERLRSCGVEPINNIVDAANYVMLEIGQPLHAFDLNKISNKKIFVRRAKTGEQINALDDKTYKLNENNLVIADSEKMLAIAGIKGGKDTAIDKNTKDIFIESANFEPSLIRISSQELGLKTDASLRFEHWMDPNMTESAADRLAQLIQEVAGGEIVKNRIDFYPKKILPRKLKLDLEKAESLLGVNLGKKEVINILNSLGLKTKADLTVEIPTWRPDLVQNEDLTEEIGRIYGYKNIESSFPKLALAPAKRNDNISWGDKIKDFLRQAGFTEEYNYSFISRKLGDMAEGGLVELENPFSEEFYYLRPNLLFNLWGNTQYNIKNLNTEQAIKIFELGKVFKKYKGEVIEKKSLSAIMTGKDSFYALKGVIDSLFEKLGISDYYFDEYQATPESTEFNLWDREAMAEIKINGKELGFLGELKLPVLDKNGRDCKIFAFDIDMEALVTECNEEYEYMPISKFPAAIRDIALLVPQDVRVGDILNIINTSENKYIRDVDLFDFYEGPQLPEDRKSLAFHIIFQADDKTLNKQEIDLAMKKITDALEENDDWEVRKSA